MGDSVDDDSEVLMRRGVSVESLPVLVAVAVGAWLFTWGEGFDGFVEVGFQLVGAWAFCGWWRWLVGARQLFV